MNGTIKESRNGYGRGRSFGMGWLCFCLGLCLIAAGNAGAAGERFSDSAQLVEGFSSILTFANSGSYSDYRFGATQSWWMYCREEEQEISWLTGTPKERKETCFVWCGTIGENYYKGAKLYLNGKYLLTLESGVGKDTVWKEGKYRLYFDFKREYRGNEGIWYLTIPAEDVVVGKPSKLKIGDEQMDLLPPRYAWFMLKSHTDVVAYEVFGKRKETEVETVGKVAEVRKIEEVVVIPKSEIREIEKVVVSPKLEIRENDFTRAYYARINSWLSYAQTKLTKYDIIPECKYLLTPYLPPGDTRGGTSNEAAMKMNCGYVLAAGVVAKFGDFDPALAGGTTRARLKSDVISVIRYLSRTHKTGAYTTPDGKKWGNHWQSAWWASEFGLGAWLLWEDLDKDTKECVARVIEYEANRFNNRIPPSRKYRDTAAESNSWDAILLSLAANMLARHPNAAVWDKQAKTYMMNTLSVFADRFNHTKVDGKKVCDWVVTENAFVDYTVENHGHPRRSRHSPIYLNLCERNLGNCALMYLLAGKEPPEASRHHAQDAWLSGKLAFGYNDLRAYYSLIHKDPEAAKQEQNRLDRLREKRGRFYSESAERIEGDEAHFCANAYLLYALQTPYKNRPVAWAGQDRYGKTGKEIQFDGSKSVGDGISYEWDFGDGKQAVGREVSHTYNAESVYTVTLTIKDRNGLSDRDTLYLFVDETPPASPDLKISIKGETIALNWSPSPEWDVSHYRIYYSKSRSKSYTLLKDKIGYDFPEHSFRVKDLFDHYFVVRAVDNAGNESKPSVPVYAERME